VSTAKSSPIRRFNWASCVQISTLRTKPNPPTTKTGAKRRGDAIEDAFSAPDKRKKFVNAKEQPPLGSILRTNAPASRSERSKEGKANGVSKRTTKTEKTLEESGDDADAGLEDAYEHKVCPAKQVARSSSRDEEKLNDTSDSEADAVQLTHETVAKKAQRDRIRSRRVHHVPLDETKEQRDARTVFLGNVPMEFVKSKVCPSSLSWPHFSPFVSLL
jgi:nucleolar protein 12